MVHIILKLFDSSYGKNKLIKVSIAGSILLILIIGIIDTSTGFLILIFFIMLAGVVWLIHEMSKPSGKTIRNKHITEKYGSQKGAAILSKQLIIGMSKEEVFLAKGKPAFIKQTVKSDGKIEKLYWEKFEYRKSIKYKKYAILINEILTEFGDV